MENKGRPPKPKPECEPQTGGCGGDCACSAAYDTKVFDETDKYKDLYLRTLADFENFKRRNLAAVQMAELEGIFEAAQILLPVFDAIDKAIKVTAGDVQQGLRACLASILSGFKKLGIEPIFAVGAEFDPNYHNAVAVVENAEQPGIVIEEYQRGFRMGERVLRYSMVSVGK